jgi:plasmid stability protein
MGQVLVQDVDDAVIAAHRRRAAARGISLEDELREVLHATAMPDRRELLERMDRCRAMTPASKRTPVAEIVRAIRDEA